MGIIKVSEITFDLCKRILAELGDKQNMYILYSSLRFFRFKFSVFYIIWQRIFEVLV